MWGGSWSDCESGQVHSDGGGKGRCEGIRRVEGGSFGTSGAVRVLGIPVGGHLFVKNFMEETVRSLDNSLWIILHLNPSCSSA